MFILEESFGLRLASVELLYPDRTLVQAAIDGSSNSERTTDDGADAGQEPGERLGTGLPVDHLHGGDVVVEEDTGDTGGSVQTLLVTLVSGIAAHEGPLVRGHGVLVRLDAAVVAVADAVAAERDVVRGGAVDVRGDAGVPAERQVGGGDNLDEVHVVEGGQVGLLDGVVERVGVVVVGPLPAVGELVRQLGAEAQLVDVVRHRVLLAGWLVQLEVVLQVVHVDVAAAEAAPRRDVEVAHHLVHPQHALQAAPLAPLRVNPRRVPLALALFDVLALAERPLVLRVGLAYLLACVAAPLRLARLLWDTAAFAAVVRV